MCWGGYQRGKTQEDDTIILLTIQQVIQSQFSDQYWPRARKTNAICLSHLLNLVWDLYIWVFRVSIELKKLERVYGVYFNWEKTEHKWCGDGKMNDRSERIK